MKRVLVSLGFLLLLGCTGERGTGIEAPPVEYTQCEHTSTVEIVSNPNYNCREVLGYLGPNQIYLGCYVPWTNTIVMPPNDNSEWWQELLAHERAHECGWRHKLRETNDR